MRQEKESDEKITIKDLFEDADESKRQTEMALLECIEPEQWVNTYLGKKDIDKKYLLCLIKAVGEETGKNFEQDIKNKIRRRLKDESWGILVECFNCEESGFHLWDFDSPDISIDTHGELELYLECKLCESRITLYGKCNPSKEALMDE